VKYSRWGTSPRPGSNRAHVLLPGGRTLGAWKVGDLMDGTDWEQTWGLLKHGARLRRQLVKSVRQVKAGR
jgi:hypothetical protein